MNENVIEWLKGQQTVAVTLVGGTKLANTVIKLSKEHEEVDVRINNDGSVCAHLPLKWIRIKPVRQVSEEQREAARERFIRCCLKRNDG